MSARALSLLALFVVCLSARVGTPPKTSIQGKIAAVKRSFPKIDRGRLGYQFIDLDSNKVVAELDPERFFTPASNAKLYTTALALERLGAAYTFKTELRTSGAWTAGQSVISDLAFVGGGDPNLSARVLPYVVPPPGAAELTSESIPVLDELSNKLAQLGIREIDGDVTGVATRYAGRMYPDGWTIDDSTYSYGAPVSALALNDNAVSIELSPAGLGELAALDVWPKFSDLIFQNRVITDGSEKTKVAVERIAGTNEVVLRGSIGTAAQSWREDLAVDDPALFAAEGLIDALQSHGITVRGEARSLYAAESTAVQSGLDSYGTLLGSHESAPLGQIIQVVNKTSQNLHAEMLLREVGLVTHGAGTLDAGSAEREQFLAEAGITRDGTGFALADASGLARQDLTTPASTVALLRYMWGRPEQETWLQTFPVGGLDGSLEHRFAKMSGAERIHAKTGSLSHVSALSGYLETKQHHWLAFSIMANGEAIPESEVRDFIDHLCAIFLSI